MPDYLENQEPNSGGFDAVLSSMKAKYGDVGNPASRAPRMPAFDAPARIRELAPQYGLDPDFVLKIGRQESGLQHYGPGGRVKTSPQGAVGVMQVLPATARKYGYDANDPEQNIHAGLSELKSIRDRWGDDDALTLSGYHSGIEDAEKALRNPRGNPKTHHYVRSILGNDGYTQALANHGGQSAPAQSAFGDVLSGLKAKYEPGTSPQAESTTPAAPGSFDDVLNSVKARVEPVAPPSKAQWGDDAPVTPANVQARIDELRTNQHVPGEQKTIAADTLADYAKQHGYQDSDITTPHRGITRHVTAEENATTDLYNQGATIMQHVTPDKPIVSKVTGASTVMPLAPVDAHAVPQAKVYSPPVPPQVQININPDETPDVKEIGRRVYRSLGFTDSEAEQYAKEMNAPDAPSAFYANYGDPVKAAQAIKQMSHADPASLGRINIPGLNEKAIAETKQWLNEKRQREYQQGMEGWHQATLERLASLPPEQREQAAYARAQAGPVPEDVRQALNVSPGVVPRVIAGTAEFLMPWLPAARQMVGAKGSTADDVSTALNASAQGVGGVIRSAVGVQKLIDAPLRHIPGVGDLLNWRDFEINDLVDEVSKKAQKELNLHKPSGLYGEILESSSRMAPEVAASILLPEGKAAHLAYWANLAFHNAKARGASDEDALKEAALAGAMIGAAAPLRPLAGAGGDAAKEALLKAGARAGLGAVTGYGIAKSQGADDNQAISMAVQFGAMNLAGAGKRESPVDSSYMRTDAAEPNPVPESKATVDEQMQALRGGRRQAVIITPGTEVPEVPKGFVATDTPKGTIIHDPRVVTPEEVQQHVANGSHGSLLGHVEPKGENTNQIVVARNPQTGVEQQASYASPERVNEQAAKFENQFPGTRIETGGKDVEQRVLDQRGNALAADNRVVVEARGDDPLAAVEAIQEASRAGRSVEVAPGGDDAASRELFAALADEFKDTPGVTFRGQQSPFDEFWQSAGVEQEQRGRVVTVNDKQITLTGPEQIAAYDKAQARYNRQIELAKQAGGDRGAALRKQAGMEFAAEKRRITGELTDRERADAQEQGFYKGKKVSFELNGRTVTGAVSSTPFGKVRVQLADGKMVTVEAADVRPSISPLSTPDELARASAPRMDEGQRAGLADLSDALGRNVVESHARQRFGKSAAELNQSEARQALAELRKQARAKGLNVGDESGPQSASQFVRSKGGIQYEEMYSGETRRLNSKESETTGLVSRSRSRGLPPDKMREALVESGYLPEDATISDMYDLVERDAGGEKVYSQQDEARQRQLENDLAAGEREYLSSADEQGHAGYDRIEQALSDPQFSHLLDRLHEPDATRADERAFYEAAKRHGIPEDFADETLAFARSQRSQPAVDQDRPASSAQSADAAANREAGATEQTRQRQGHVTPVVYHGTPYGGFESFNKEAAQGLGRESGHPTADLGYWFSESPEVANRFAVPNDYSGESSPAVYPARLELKNPARYTTFKELAEDVKAAGSAEELRRQLQQQGHDGVVINQSATDGAAARRDYVAFSPEQIRGVFSSDVPQGTEHHSNFQPRNDAGEFAGPPDYTLTPKLAEPPKQTEGGYFFHYLHKQEGGQFFDDSAVKAALGLSESAKSSDVHNKLRDLLAPEVPGERPSLSRVSPDDLREWAVSRDLPDETIAKLDQAHAAAKEKVSRNVRLGGRADDHPQIVDWRTEMGESNSELSFGVNPDRAIKSAAVLGYDLARGAKGFADWSQQMLSRLGERVKPLLRSLWDEVKGLAAGDDVDTDSIAHLREKAARAMENEKGAVSLDLLTLGIAPAVRKIDAGVRKLFAPDSISKQATLTGNAIRANRGVYERDVAAANDGLHSLRNGFLRMPEADQVDFLDRLQNRQPQPTAELQSAHDALRRVYDAQVRRLAPRQQVRLATDYLSAYWKDAAAAKDFYSKWYQSHPPSDPPTIKDGLAAGLKPKSTNPVDVAMWHFNTARRFQFGQDFTAEMQAKGMAEYVGPGKGPKNRDWVKVDEAIQSKTGNQTGAYYMPEDAARVVNAWLSPDLKGRDDILGMGFRGINRVNNWLNMFTLGWSAFHGTFTGLQSMFGQFNNSLQHLQAGRVVKATLEAGKVPISVPLDLRLGGKIISEYNAPGTQAPEIARMVDAVTKAGGRIGEDSIYRTGFRKQFMDAIRSGNYPQVAKNSLGAALEAGTAPILGWFVPRVKAAAFAKRAMLELDRLGPNATEDAQRAALTKQWDVVDDFFGQFVYDNSFANNAVKDIAKTTIGRFGWQYGTLRAGIGATAEVAATPARVVRAVKAGSTAGNAPIADRTGYAIGMVLMTGIAGGLTTYLMTGERPKDAKDYFWPRTGATKDDGSPERIAFPTYINEAYNWTTKPGQTATHKISPAIHLFNDLLVRNADFQNVQIRNPQDSLGQQAKDVVAYLGKQILPISVQSVQKSREQGQGVGRQVAGVFGLKNAPSDIDVSPALALTRQYMGERMPSGVVTQSQMAKRQAMRELEKGVRNKVPVGDKARQFIRSGVLSDDDVDRAIDHVDTSPLEAGFKRLTYEQKLNVLDKATPDERKLLAPMLDDKGLDKLPDTKARQLKQRARQYEAHN